MPGALPETIDNEAQLDDVLSDPSEVVIDAVGRLEGPLVILGAGGKMGPSLAMLARRAALAAGNGLEVVAVSRFSDAASREMLDRAGVTTIAADLLRSEDVNKKLPDASHVVYLVGMKFGTSKDPSATWVANTLVPSLVMQHYPAARIVALSTGNVYPLALVSSGGSREDDPMTPIGEYANATVARERVFQYFSQQQNTPVVLLRLSYAVDLRYGVVVDLARKVLQGEPIRLETGHFNTIWQGDANEMILRSFPLASVPPTALNLSSTRMISVREAAGRLGELLGREPRFEGSESGTAFVSNTQRMVEALGQPRVAIDTLLRWTAHWVASGGRSLDRPTHFETRDGKY